MIDQNKKLIYIAHPYNGLEVNITKATDLLVLLQQQYLHQYTFVSPIHGLNVGLLYECLTAEIAISNCINLLKRCDEVWAAPGWRQSSGCLDEYHFCCKNKIPFYEMKFSVFPLLINPMQVEGKVEEPEEPKAPAPIEEKTELPEHDFGKIFTKDDLAFLDNYSAKGGSVKALADKAGIKTKVFYARIYRARKKFGEKEPDSPEAEKVDPVAAKKKENFIKAMTKRNLSRYSNEDLK